MGRLYETLQTRATAWFLAALGTFLCLQLFVLPDASVFLGGDQWIYMMEARRMLEGQVIYRDFFEFLPAGIDLVYKILLDTFGPRAWIPNAALVLLGVSLAGLCVMLSKQILTGSVAYLPALLFVVFAFRSGLDGTHHWFSALAVVAAVAVLIENRTVPRVAAAGVLCGIASDFTTTRGFLAAVGFALYLIWEARRRRRTWRELWRFEFVLLAGFLLPVIALNAYFVWKVGQEQFVEATVGFLAKYYAKDAQWNTLQVYMTEVPPAGSWHRWPILGVWLFNQFLQPMIYLLIFSRYWRARSLADEKTWDKLMLLNITGLFLFVGVAPAPATVRLVSISLPALILFTWYIHSWGRAGKILIRLLAVAAMILAVGASFERQVRREKILDLPSGRTAFLNPVAYERFRWMLEHTRPGEYFFEGEFADMYYPLLLRNPAKVPFLTNTEYTRPEHVEDVVKSLEKQRVRLVHWSLVLDVPRGNKAGDNLGPLRKYLRDNYRLVQTFSDSSQVWERVESGPPAIDRGQANRSGHSLEPPGM